MICTFHARRRAFVLAALWLLGSATTGAQSEHVHSAPATDGTRVWTWSWDANAFAGWNYQRRKFRDFQKIESQNWLMGAADRPVASWNPHVPAAFRAPVERL